MAIVFSSFSTSLDGFIADPDDRVGPLFDWYNSGDVEIKVPGAPPFQLSEASARHWHEVADSEGAAVYGRRIFDHTKGWGGTPPLGVPAFVVTHRPPPPDWPPVPDAPFTFVFDGVESAVEQARAAAGEHAVGVAGADIAQQCLNAGLLDEVRIDLVPVLLGSGIRYFDNLADSVEFDDPTVIEGVRVTHLRYRVKRR